MNPSTSVIAGVPSPGAIARVAIGDFLRRLAARDRSKTAFVLGDQRMSYGELDERVTRCATMPCWPPAWCEVTAWPRYAITRLSSWWPCSASIAPA